MFGAAAMSNSTCISVEASLSSDAKIVPVNHHDFSNGDHHELSNGDSLASLSPQYFTTTLFSSPQPLQQPQLKPKKKRGQPGNPDPDAEVIALSPNSLMATNRFICEVCNKGFQRDQNLQLHRRGHNLPWKLRQRSSGATARRRVYVCPEKSCVHNHPSRALGDLTGIKKHFFRKHGEKRWKCERCSKRYAVMSDWKAHVKTCGTRKYKCDCGTIFSRRDSFVTHRAFCDALAEESARLIAAAATPPPLLFPISSIPTNPGNPNPNPNTIINPNPNPHLQQPYFVKPDEHPLLNPNIFTAINGSPSLSATALLQRACAVGVMPSAWHQHGDVDLEEFATLHKVDPMTRDFLGGAAIAWEAQNDELPPLELDCAAGDPSFAVTWEDC